MALVTPMEEHGLDLPPVDFLSCAKMTIASMESVDTNPNVSLRNTIQAQLHSKGGDLRFQKRYFRESDIHRLPEFIAQEATASTGLLLVILENWQAWAYNALKASLSNFPTKLLEDVNENKGIEMLPQFDRDRGYWHIMDHIDIAPTPECRYTAGSFHMGFWEARREPEIATWSQTHGALPNHPDRPVLVVFGQASSRSITDKLIDHYRLDGPRRWNRLNECLYWFYLDVFFVFTNWDSTLEMARLNLEPKERQLFDQRKNIPIQDQTRELHRDASTSLALQESIRLHHAALKRFQRGVSQLPMSDSLELLNFRLDDVAELLVYYDNTANTILEQQKNLLSLTFNIETVMQTQAVARINILAFIFLPLSFVAGIFGMTTISAPAKWYPVAAIPVLVVTLSFAYGVNQFTNFLESRSRHRHLQPSHKSSNIWRYISRLLYFRNDQTTLTNEEALDDDQVNAINSPTLLVDGNCIGQVDSDFYSKSSAALGYRVRGVARVDSNHLTVGKYGDAASGPLFSPSGSLRH